MTQKRIIKAGDIIRDIRAGMTDAALMEKYKLSTRGLESAFLKLVSGGLLSVREIYGDRSAGEDTVIIDDTRSLPRFYLTVTIPIYEASEPNVVGRVDNVSERGLGVSGIQARIGETKSFVVPTAKLLKGIENIWFEARCIWVEPNRDTQLFASGYQITKILPDAMNNLRKLIKVVTFGA
jgi:hypothetical protein